VRSLTEVLVREGFASPDEAASAADRASRTGMSLVKAVIASNLVSEFDLAEALGRALDLPVVDLAGGELDEDAIRLVPADLAERRTLVPMGIDPATRVLRIAIADPLDAEGLREVHRATGMQVAPMVATLSSIDRAIQRYYHRTSTKVVPRPSRTSGSHAAAPPAIGEVETDKHFAESTKKVSGAAVAEAMTPGTVPMYSIEEEASVEVRLRALLMALEDRGLLTHADYVEALRRVLGVG
jgi:hypothetical protein